MNEDSDFDDYYHFLFGTDSDIEIESELENQNLPHESARGRSKSTQCSDYLSKSKNPDYFGMEEHCF